MSIPLSYLMVIIIWSTTPLAIKWSSAEIGFQYGVAGRMLIGLLALTVLIKLLKINFPRHKHAWRVYFISGLSLYLAMSFVYWAAQYIPSGWISVVFGISPIFTSLLAHIILKEPALSKIRLMGLLLGLFGLVAIFIEGATISKLAIFGIIAIIMSVIAQSLGAVLLKQQKPSMHPIAIATGSLLIALPLFIINCGFSTPLPETISLKPLLSIIYLALVGTTFGFPLYYFLLKHISAERVAIITLITPVTALLLGAFLNNELISAQIWGGTTLIIIGLVIYEYGKYLPHVKKWKIRWLQKPL